MQVQGPNQMELSSILAQLRHMYHNMKMGRVKNEPSAIEIADGILARQIVRLERLQRTLDAYCEEAETGRNFTAG